ncbi:MAG: single-stranded DNA-binding protein [Patescibacteria group bacterium]|nr:single-stranded DNA-binding protein [Patescibacteria group bacterium]
MNLNRVFILGNLAADPENRMLPSGQPVTNLRIATNRVWTDQSGKKQEAAEFHRVVAFGRLAEIAAQYLAKGRLVFIEGRIQTRSWQAQDGTKRYQTEIVAEGLQLGPRMSTGQEGSAHSRRPDGNGDTGARPSAGAHSDESVAAPPGEAGAGQIPTVSLDDEDTGPTAEFRSPPQNIRPEDLPF